MLGCWLRGFTVEGTDVVDIGFEPHLGGARFMLNDPGTSGMDPGGHVGCVSRSRMGGVSRVRVEERQGLLEGCGVFTIYVTTHVHGKCMLSKVNSHCFRHD